METSGMPFSDCDDLQDKDGSSCVYVVRDRCCSIIPWVIYTINTLQTVGQALQLTIFVRSSNPIDLGLGQSRTPTDGLARHCTVSYGYCYDQLISWTYLD
ncbi:hypothetical protein PoB_006905400 [Plakobranchus ocellatus]|uniref:Uncharacterized protein n=1 Tax=Plakobranchus ocellatus TaxID=259542 RepID=A0AAV4DEC9_9GAST|nr:hypothetical protein PoB_006905400 [Plakobranchus ocellatus]